MTMEIRKLWPGGWAVVKVFSDGWEVVVGLLHRTKRAARAARSKM